jgi:hypothetical protein
MYDDWNMDELRIDVEYSILEESAALRAASSPNCNAVAGVRSNNRGGYLHDESSQPEDEGTAIAEYESPQFHLCRHELIDLFHVFCSKGRRVRSN